MEEHYFFLLQDVVNDSFEKSQLLTTIKYPQIFRTN